MSSAARSRRQRQHARRWLLVCAASGLAPLLSGAGCARLGFEDLASAVSDAGAGGARGGSNGNERDGVDADSAAPPDVPGPPSTPPPDATPTDGSPPAPCVLGEPELLGAPNSPGNDLWSPSLASDGRSLFFAVLVPGWVEQVAVSTRAAPGAAFGDGQLLPAPVNVDTEGTPNVSADGLSLYFFSQRGGGSGGRDLYVATRANTSADFDTVRELSALNTPEREHLPRISADGLTLHFVSNRTGDSDIWRATRASSAADFAVPQPVPELNSANEDGAVTLSPDGLEAILSSDRATTVGGRDLYRATRTRTDEPFSTPEPLTALNSTSNDYDPTLTFDGTELYFVSNRRGGNTEIYRSQRSCP